MLVFFFSSRRRHTRWNCDWSSDVCSSDLPLILRVVAAGVAAPGRSGLGCDPGWPEDATEGSEVPTKCGEITFRGAHRGPGGPSPPACNRRLCDAVEPVSLPVCLCARVTFQRGDFPP